MDYNDSKIKHTNYVTFSVNPFAQLDLIIEHKSLNQHNLFVLTPTRMGFDPTLIETSHSPDDIGLIARAESDIGTESHIDVCCHHSDAAGSRSPCTQCCLITNTADNDDGGHSSTRCIPTMGEEWGPSTLWTGSGLDRPPSETGTRVHTVILNAASVLPCGINLNGDEIDDVTRMGKEEVEDWKRYLVTAGKLEARINFYMEAVSGYDDTTDCSVRWVVYRSTIR